MQLNPRDLQFALRRLPKPLIEAMKDEDGPPVMVGGGYLRSVVAGESVNDIDVFSDSKDNANTLAIRLSTAGRSGGKTTRRIYKTDNAFTVLGYNPTIQIIHRWNFESIEALCQSFDFTCCAAAFQWLVLNPITGFKPRWHSYCVEDFYPSIAAKRLEYTSPDREEEAGGSMLRVLKYYQKGYRIPLDSLAKVITRLVNGVRRDSEAFERFSRQDPSEFARVVCGLLREVDPDIDPNHVSHLPGAEDFARDQEEETQ